MQALKATRLNAPTDPEAFAGDTGGVCPANDTCLHIGPRIVSQARPPVSAQTQLVVGIVYTSVPCLVRLHQQGDATQVGHHQRKFLLRVSTESALGDKNAVDHRES